MSQSPVIQLLHRADALVPQFNVSLLCDWKYITADDNWLPVCPRKGQSACSCCLCFGVRSSLSDGRGKVKTPSRSHLKRHNRSQMSNMQRLMERTGQQTPASGSVRERTLAKLQNTIEEALAGIRGELANMENVVEQLKDLLFQADVFLADPSNALQYAGNPTEALNHVSSLYDSYQAELLEKREVCTLLYISFSRIGQLIERSSGDGFLWRRRNYSRTVCSSLEGHVRSSECSRSRNGRSA